MAESPRCTYCGGRDEHMRDCEVLTLGLSTTAPGYRTSRSLTERPHDSSQTPFVSMNPLTLEVQKNELDEMWEKVRVWKKDKAKLRDWLHEHMLLFIQLAAKRAIEVPPGQKSVAVQSRLISEFMELATDIMSALKSEGVDAPPSSRRTKNNPGGGGRGRKSGERNQGEAEAAGALGGAPVELADGEGS